MKTPVQQVLPDLNQFYGSETRYRHGLVRHVSFSEGVQYVAEKAGAYWLVDKVATNQHDPKIRREEFQVWKLTVADGKGKLVCDDGNGIIVHEEEITFTDFPAPGIDFWYTNGTIYLPSEH